MAKKPKRNKKRLPKKGFKKTTPSKIIKENLPSFIIGVIVVVILILAGINSIGWMAKETERQTELRKNAESKIVKYKIQEGDDLCNIAQKFYQSCDRASDIAKINNIIDPNLIEIGQILSIPRSKKLTITPTITKGSTSSLKTTKARTDLYYIVKEGDDLFGIAQKQYGDGNMWPRIAEANDLVSPDFLSKGSKLIIPR